MAPSASQKRLALAIIDFLSTSLTDGTLSQSDSESIEIAQSCIADTFHVEPSDKAAMNDALSGQSLLSIYSVYEKLRGKTSSNTTGLSSTAEERPSASATAATPSPEQVKEADALKSKGNAALQKKDYDVAIDLYTQALALVPNNVIYLSNRAAAYSASGKHDLAVKDAELAVKENPKYSKAWSRLGFARYLLGDASGSVEAYERGIEAEGNGGSEAMKRGLETAKKRVADEEANAATSVDNEASRAAPSGGAGGLPDLSSLLGGMGGGAGGGPDLSSLMNNPMFSSMASKLMSNPDLMSSLMSNPRLRQMADSFGQGNRDGNGNGGGAPDIASLMSDPSIAEMARNLMGGGAGRGSQQ